MGGACDVMGAGLRIAWGYASGNAWRPVNKLEKARRASKSWKPPKWPENDQFPIFNFWNMPFFRSNCTPFDAESQEKIFETVARLVSRSVLELSSKNVSKNRRPNFPDHLPSEKWFSLRTRNWTKFGGCVTHIKLKLLAKFQTDPTTNIHVTSV